MAKTERSQTRRWFTTKEVLQELFEDDVQNRVAGNLHKKTVEKRQQPRRSTAGTNSRYNDFYDVQPSKRKHARNPRNTWKLNECCESGVTTSSNHYNDHAIASNITGTVVEVTASNVIEATDDAVPQDREVINGKATITVEETGATLPNIQGTDVIASSFPDTNDEATISGVVEVTVTIDDAVNQDVEVITNVNEAVIEAISSNNGKAAITTEESGAMPSNIQGTDVIASSLPDTNDEATISGVVKATVTIDNAANQDIEVITIVKEAIEAISSNNGKAATTIEETGATMSIIHETDVIASTIPDTNVEETITGVVEVTVTGDNGANQEIEPINSSITEATITLGDNVNQDSELLDTLGLSLDISGAVDELFGLVSVDQLFTNDGDNLVMAVPFSIMNDSEQVNDYIVSALSTVVESSNTVVTESTSDMPSQPTLDLTESSSVPAVPDLEGSSICEPQRGRRKVRDEAGWKRNVLKRKRNCGEQYINPRGVTVPQKCVQQFDCGGCRYKCKSKLSEDDREAVFNSYWKLADKNLQNDFITAHISVDSKSDGHKNSRQYHLTVDGVKVRVCKEFFLKTLNVSNKLVDYNVRKVRTEFGTNKLDQRGRNVSANKISTERLNTVRNHISSFPSMESHYARRDSQKKYLDSSLSVSKMYKLYSDCTSNPVSQSMYRHIFDTEFNLSFHRPKKDFCKFCTTFNNSTPEEKSALQCDYDQHHARKNRVREIKAELKKKVTVDSKHVAITFDLQQVLSTPKLAVSTSFYKRKLSTYNLTTYNLGSGAADCFMWHECVGGRGSNEIASCISKYIKSLPAETSDLYMFSDTCGGQNRNIQMSVALMHACKTSDHLKTITQFMMESGHSQMECDSVHSTIERSCKFATVYTPMDYYAIVGVSRREQPYLVNVMETTDFKDYKSLVSSYVKNRNKCTKVGEILPVGRQAVANWMKMKVLKYSKDQPGTMEFAYEYDGPFYTMTLNHADAAASQDQSTVCTSTRKLRGRQVHVTKPKEAMPVNLKCLYSSPIPISKAKYDDLMDLCESHAIIRDHHHFYHELPFKISEKPERLPEPDVDDDETDSESCD